MIGKALAHFEITGLLGKGGMGEVFRARDTRLGRELAIKVLPESFASSPEALTRFKSEARIVAGLNHPNIVVLYSVEEDAGIHFLTMELCHGQSLDRLVEPGGLPLAKVLEIMTQLAEAMIAAHSQGIVHRDLKPGNVMISAEGRVKVLDFGLAKLIQEPAPSSTLNTTTSDTPISAQGSIKGTAPFMAPEQLRAQPVDARTDLFALGVIMYELITGNRPFAGDNFADISAEILRSEPVSIDVLRPDLPADINRIVCRCLAKEPLHRYQTAVDVLNELNALKETSETRKFSIGKQSGATTPSIAVLPFLNRSHDPEDEYFSDGLADELLNMLAKIRGFRVAARTSAFFFKGKDTTIAKVGRELNVATVLEGSVRKAGNRVRISVQLVKVADGYQMWSETYDRTLEDIFAVQDDIAQAVVTKLRETLLGESTDGVASGRVKAEIEIAAKGRGQNPEAHRLYLQARHVFDRRNHEDNDRGIGYLKEALALDPDFAAAWAELAGAYSREADSGWVPVDEGMARAREAAERSLSLEPDLPEGHAQLGWINVLYDWEWRTAEVRFQRALELAPGNPAALSGAGRLALDHGRFEESFGYYRRALDQDPLMTNIYHSLALAHWYADRLVEAEAGFRKALELAPQRSVSPTRLAFTLLGQSRGQEALAMASHEPDHTFRAYALAIIHHNLGQVDESNRALQELSNRHHKQISGLMAEAHGARGEMDAAFRWLEEGFRKHDPGLAAAMISPFFRGLHDDHRWPPFLDKMGFRT